MFTGHTQPRHQAALRLSKSDVLLNPCAPPYFCTRTRSGAALVLVLAALALVSFFILAILTFTRSEDRGSRAAADLVQVRMLAALPEKLVISQIRRATGKPVSGAGRGLANDSTWTSQPGMIRVFGTDANPGSPRARPAEFYKLYSSRQLTLPGEQSSQLMDEVNRLQDWMKSPAEFVDLNEPVRVEHKRRLGVSRPYGDPYFVFPILDPNAKGLVDGFDVLTSAYDDGAPAPAQAPNGGFNPTTGSQQPVMAMPVTWLYVLKDGSIVAPSRSNGGVSYFDELTSKSGTVHTSEKDDNNNLIVGRIAFWTDDESCKLNVNTASEPAPWEPPHVHTLADENYANSIPAKGEHYRESGHPAYTSLSPVLRNFNHPSTSTQEPMREPADMANGGAQWWRHIDAWHSILPKAFPDHGGDSALGSKGGTQQPTDELKAEENRLFPTVDEVVYRKDANASNDRIINSPNNTSLGPDINPEDLSKVRFFLTTHNRAPELNLYNRPKISLWPLFTDQAGLRNQTDRKFALATTLAGHPYYFQRANEWLNTTTVGSSQTTGNLGLNKGEISMARNQDIIAYLRSLTELDVPGFGSKFVDAGQGKLSPEGRDQLLISMLDLVRWGVNPGSPFNQVISPQLTPQYNYLPPAWTPGTPATAIDGVGANSASPLRLDTQTGQTGGETNPHANSDTPHTKGYGRFPTITEVAVVFIATKGVVVALPPGAPAAPYAGVTTEIQSFVILQPFNPAPGVAPIAPAYSCNIYGLNNFKLNGNFIGFKPSATTSFLRPVANAGLPLSGTAGDWGGDHSAYAGMSSQFLQPAGAIKPPQVSSQTPEQFFAALSDPVPLTSWGLVEANNTKVPAGTAGTVFHFSGGSVQVEILDQDKETVQTIEMEFPPTDIPVPLLPLQNGAAPALSENQIFKARFTVQSPPTAAPGKYRMALIQPGDVVRSMVLAGSKGTTLGPVTYAGSIAGDARMLAGRVHVKAPSLSPGVTSAANEHYLIPHPGYFDAETALQGITKYPFFTDAGRYAQSLRDGAYMAVSNTPATGPWAADLQIGFKSPPPIPGSPPPAIVLPPPLMTPDTGGSLAVRGPSGTPNKLSYPVTAIPATPLASKGALNAEGQAGDFDNGPGVIEDGPYINMPDMGTVANQKATGTGRYFDRGGLFAEEDGVSFSPWRQASSAIIFGSLPTGVYGWAGDPVTPRPWQTLLFCPNPASRTTPAGTEPQFDRNTGGTRDHFGFLTPRDHLWLENFWMPAVEPAGMSDGFSTEGKVNMNYQIMPFLWIKRASAMYGALHGVRVTAIPSTAVSSGAYKDPGTASSLEFRYAVDARKTLAAFDDRFYDPSSKTTDVFRSPSEICEMFLVPKRLDGHTYAGGAVNPPDPDTVFPNTHDAYKQSLEWWEGSNKSDPNDAFEATGDNLREAPYAQLYPRLCTRSNVFTVHYRVQLLKKSRSTPRDQWKEGVDNVVAEYRGQSTIERYLDPADTSIPDFAAAPHAAQAVDDFYKYRVLNRRQFSP